MCSSQTPPETPRNTTEKQVEPIRMNTTMVVEAHGRFVALLDQVAQVRDAHRFEAEPDDGEIDHREGKLEQFALAEQNSDDGADAQWR